MFAASGVRADERMFLVSRWEDVGPERVRHLPVVTQQDVNPRLSGDHQWVIFSSPNIDFLRTLHSDEQAQ